MTSKLYTAAVFALDVAILILPIQASAQCIGYAGPGGPCSTDPGGGLSTGPGGGLSTGPGGGPLDWAGWWSLDWSRWRTFKWP